MARRIRLFGTRRRGRGQKREQDRRGKSGIPQARSHLHDFLRARDGCSHPPRLERGRVCSQRSCGKKILTTSARMDRLRNEFIPAGNIAAAVESPVAKVKQRRTAMNRKSSVRQRRCATCRDGIRARFPLPRIGPPDLEGLRRAIVRCPDPGDTYAAAIASGPKQCHFQVLLAPLSTGDSGTVQMHDSEEERPGIQNGRRLSRLDRTSADGYASDR